MRRGLTLIELIVVVVAIGLLILLLSPPHCGGRGAARRAHCHSNLKQLGLALQLYATDNAGLLPMWAPDGRERPTASLGMLYQDGLAGDWQLFRCPSDPRRKVGEMKPSDRLERGGPGMTEAMCSYAYDPGEAGVHPRCMSDPAHVVVLCDRPSKDLTTSANHAGVNVLTVANAVRWVPDRPKGETDGAKLLTSRCGHEGAAGAFDDIYTRDPSLDRSLDAHCRWGD